MDTKKKCGVVGGGVKMDVQMVADDNEKKNPSPAGLQKTCRETSLKVLLQSPGLPPLPHRGISVIN